jgi:hypothetical protein
MPKPTTQKTPKGAEIPVPTRKEIYGNLDKMVKAPVPARGSPAHKPESPEDAPSAAI